MIGGLAPSGTVDDIARLLIEKGAERPAGENVVEAGVHLLIFPVVSPYMTTGIGMVEWFKVAS